MRENAIDCGDLELQHTLTTLKEFDATQQLNYVTHTLLIYPDFWRKRIAETIVKIYQS